MLVSWGGTVSDCASYAKQYNVIYPVIAGTSGGEKIHAAFNHNVKITVCLVDPTRKVVEKDIWPINSTDDVRKAVKKYLATPIVFDQSKSVSEKCVWHSADNRLFVQTGNSDQVKNLFLYTVQGRCVWSGAVAQGTRDIVIPMNTLSGNKYIMRIETGRSIETIPVLHAR